MHASDSTDVCGHVYLYRPTLSITYCQLQVRNMAVQIVLISGCSSGIGLATAVHLAKDAEKRFKVYATMRNLEKKGQLEEEGKKYLGDTLVIKQMDVCSDESVEKAVKEVLDTEGRIDVLCESSSALIRANISSLNVSKRKYRNELILAGKLQ